MQEIPSGPKTPKIDQKKIVIIAAILVALVAIFFAIRHFAEKQEEPTQPVFERKRGGPCPGETKEFAQRDPYMRGVLEVGQKFKVIMNYYDCNEPKRGDLVFYQLHHSMDPVVKIVRGVPGDKFSLSRDKLHGGWNLEVNGDKVYSAVDKKEAYFFGASTPPPLALYEKSHKGKIGPGNILLLSSWPPGDIDSGLFGMFSLTDVVGKVEPVEKKK